VTTGGVQGSGHRSVLVVVEQLRRAVPGGIGTYARGLLAGLAALETPQEARGDEAMSVTLLASRVTPDPLVVLGRPIRTSRLPSKLLTRAWDLGAVRAPSGFDVVHGASLASPARARAGRSVLSVMVHDLAWRTYPEATTRRGRRWHEAALRRTLARSDAFVVPSASVAADLLAAGAPADKVTVIPEGADHLPPPDADGAAAILRASGVFGPYLLSVSTLEPRKNLGRLLAAYQASRTSLPELLPLVVAGPLGWGDDELGEIARDGVVRVGHVEGAALAGLYAGAAAFVYVPLAEGFGLPPLEAMAEGTPVVASSAVPSVAEGEGERPALLVNPLDTDEIAQGLVRIVTDAALADTLRSRGSSWAGSRTWADTAAAHVGLWRQLT
jgi:glycosyltransferase involved in cell wall biosynthesis